MLSGSLPARNRTTAMSTRGGSPPPEARYSNGSNQPKATIEFSSSALQRLLSARAAQRFHANGHKAAVGHGESCWPE